MNPSPLRPMRQSPTAQRLAEVLSAWLPESHEGIYHRYLQSLSPDYDHLLTHSRNDRIWRFSPLSPHQVGYRSQISTLRSPIHVIDLGHTHNSLKHHKFDGTELSSMESLKNFLAGPDQNSALGSGLSLDPNVLSHHVGTSFRAIEQSTSIERIGVSQLKIDSIPTSVGAYEQDRNLQILQRHLGQFQFANVQHAKDLTFRDSAFKSMYNCDAYLPVTISIDIPRTIYVQGYQSEANRTSAIRSLRTGSLGLQDGILSRRSARQRFADDSMLCDQGERYTQSGLDILQHVTIYVTGSFYSNHTTVLAIFPPYPELDGENDPYIFLDPLSKEESTKSFRQFCEEQNRGGSSKSEQATPAEGNRVCDVEVFAKDMLGIPGDCTNTAGYVVNIVRAYAINAWLDRLQSLEAELQDLCIGKLDLTPENDIDIKSNHTDVRIHGKEIINSIYRYIASLDLDCHRLSTDVEEQQRDKRSKPLPESISMLEKYRFLKSRMDLLLAQALHVLGTDDASMDGFVGSSDSTEGWIDGCQSSEREKEDESYGSVAF
ncbi:unnamed protein product [Penicillium olsonii]|uniref:Uncharacterized protein n=1 Tax=Penicillium olsonii TaxID=99116 RepID=A0A9W4HMC4_PENOL|nr:unnamed protein product [Penicillium olsonii]CAG8290819.1 unnamed protein product [Penicillium olsonii]